MKLEKEKDILENNFWFNYNIILNLICLVSMAGIAFVNGLYIVIPLTLLPIICMIIILYLCNPKKQKSKKNTKMKDVGQKVEGNIIETGYERIYGSDYRRSRGRREIYYILVSYDNKIIKVMDLKPNMAYKILCLLLDPYPTKKDIYIPIDIYINKKNTYADLESVDLSKIKGFVEAKKIIEETQNIN